MSRDPFNSGEDSAATVAVLKRGHVVLDSIEKFITDLDENPDRECTPHEFSELVEGIGVFDYLTSFCKQITKGG